MTLNKRGAELFIRDFSKTFEGLMKLSEEI